MSKLSPAYREDDSTRLPDDIRHYLDEHFLATCPNLAKKNPKIVVVFSGGNAVGKSTLSWLISQQLGGLVLENDAIKVTLLKYKPNLSRDDLNLLTWKYSQDLYRRLDQRTPNGLIVRDGVIDWYYDRILPIFENRGYGLFIVAFKLSKKKQLELIQTRGDKQTVSVQRLLEIMDDHAIHSRRFRTAYKADIVLDDDTIFDHQLVIEKLRQRITTLKGSL